jgi:hypothetical protein
MSKKKRRTKGTGSMYTRKDGRVVGEYEVNDGGDYEDIQHNRVRTKAWSIGQQNPPIAAGGAHIPVSEARERTLDHVRESPRMNA